MINVNMNDVKLPAGVLFDDGGNLSATATLMATEALAVGMPHLTVFNAEVFFRRSVALSVARGYFDGRGRAAKKHELTFDTVLAFAGMRASVPAMDTEQFGAALAAEVLRRADPIATQMLRADEYQVTLRLTRLVRLRELGQCDRVVFTRGKQFKSVARHYTVCVRSESRDRAAIEAQALCEFWSIGHGKVIECRTHFNLEVVDVKRKGN